MKFNSEMALFNENDPERNSLSVGQVKLQVQATFEITSQEQLSGFHTVCSQRLLPSQFKTKFLQLVCKKMYCIGKEN